MVNDCVTHLSNPPSISFQDQLVYSIFIVMSYKCLFASNFLIVFKRKKRKKEEREGEEEKEREKRRKKKHLQGFIY